MSFCIFVNKLHIEVTSKCLSKMYISFYFHNQIQGIVFMFSYFIEIKILYIQFNRCSNSSLLVVKRKAI